ncbi:asparagine synthase C-terminal domain-containing protein [Micromonospora sp. NPDC005553]|uniref:asparagine synthase C-terminal domain-containing protein n=1 Tax=Micromonospora sp. NPDC005553 TaxID=3364232 RepID=UPI00369B6927
MAASRWAAVGNCDLTPLERISPAVHVGDLRVHTSGLAGDSPRTTPLEIDVRTMSVRSPNGGATPATTEPDRARILVDEDRVVVRTTALNEDAIYLAFNRSHGKLAYFTDLFLAPLILPALGLPVEVRPEGPQPRSDETALLHVSRVPFGAVQEGRRLRDGWTLRTALADDPLRHLRRPGRTDALQAGEDQVSALQEQIRSIARDRPLDRFATLLSGGIDSGTVTVLAASEGLALTPYSAGTPWGDEFDDAAELGDHLGLSVRRVELSEERILAAVPQAIRGLGVTEPEVVEVALTATALYDGTEIPRDEVLLTGYGSDLINAGIYRPFSTPEELIDQTIAAIHQTRFTNELSSRLPLAYGREVHHPFWAWSVIQVALDTAPDCKVRDGREKFHLRQAMSRRVSHDIAWRRKIAVHHGGGLQRGVVKRLETDAPGVDRAAIYLACFRELVNLAQEGSIDDWDPLQVYERGIADARR